MIVSNICREIVQLFLVLTKNNVNQGEGYSVYAVLKKLQ
jgi:hypothetical protein